MYKKKLSSPSFSPYFFYLHILAFILLGSLVLPISTYIWKPIDYNVFYLLNGFIQDKPLQGIFWSLANIKITDIYGATFFLISFFLYIMEGKDNHTRRLRIGYLIFMLVWFEITILFTKQILTPLCMSFSLSRHSPTVLLDNVLRLSQFTPWAKIKDISHFCFPSDHAVIIIQWCLFFTYFAGMYRGLLISTISIFLLLPRLISGAHWFSDAFSGGLACVIIAFAWATQSGLYYILMNFIQQKIIRLEDWEKIAYHE